MRFQLPNFLSNRQPAGPIRKFGACLTVLAVLTFMFTRLWAASDGEGEGHADEAHHQAGKLMAADDGNPQLTVSGHEDKVTVYRVSPDAKVMLNGVENTFSALKPDDALKLVLDEKKVVTEIHAERKLAGIVFAVDEPDKMTMTTDYIKKFPYQTTSETVVKLNDAKVPLSDLKVGDHVDVISVDGVNATAIEAKRQTMLAEFWYNFRKNLFKPLLLFFYMGFSVPLLKVAFEFPHIIYQGLTIYLLVSIGWKGGEELAELSGKDLTLALKFMGIGFATNFVIGIVAYLALRTGVKTLRRVDAATVAAYYGSDSAGTFVTCVGVLVASSIAYAPFMPVMLAVMEIPGCLVGLFLVSRLRKQGMDMLGNMPDEPGYNRNAVPAHEIDVAHDAQHLAAKEK
ncbi:MAG TPA: sodium-dependent bicarbonate transport family permease, partial [Planctomycetaceae bacterium]